MYCCFGFEIVQSYNRSNLTVGSMVVVKHLVEE